MITLLLWKKGDQNRRGNYIILKKTMNPMLSPSRAPRGPKDAKGWVGGWEFEKCEHCQR